MAPVVEDGFLDDIDHPTTGAMNGDPYDLHVLRCNFCGGNAVRPRRGGVADDGWWGALRPFKNGCWLCCFIPSYIICIPNYVNTGI